MCSVMEIGISEVFFACWHSCELNNVQICYCILNLLHYRTLSFSTFLKTQIYNIPFVQVFHCLHSQAFLSLCVCRRSLQELEEKVVYPE